MAPKDHLPPAIPSESIEALLAHLNLPPAASVAPLDVTADYHAIYDVRLVAPVPPGWIRAGHSGNSVSDSVPEITELILRVSGRHLPEIKTRNEIGVMTLLATNKKTKDAVPIPDVVAYECTDNSPLGYEYTLMSRASGRTLRDVWEDLDQTKKNAVFDQLIDILAALHGLEWNHIGGLNIGQDGQLIPARIVDETFWQTGDLGLWMKGDQFPWRHRETVTTLNLGGPYSSWPALVAAQMRLYTRLIGLHDKLAFLREKLVPRLEVFAKFLEAPDKHPQHWKLEETRLVLAHKDLHFANLLYDPAANNGAGGISAVLDWEFAGVVPAPLWNPRRAFLWPARPDDPDSSAKTRALVAQFEEREAMQDIADYLRALVEVCPRGQRADRVDEWVGVVHKNLDVFGV